MDSRRTYVAVAALALGLSLSACHGLKVSMDGQVPPTFNFSRGFAECCDYLRFFSVYEIPPENQNLPWNAQTPKEDIHLWRIVPNGGARYLPAITYGKVPPDCTQEVPNGGEPPLLLEGHVYQAGGPPVEVRGTLIRFTIRDGKAVRIPIPGYSE